MQKNIFRFLRLFSVITLLTACGPRSQDDFREEGEGVTRSLIQEFQSIQNRNEILQSTMRIQKLFDRLVDLMIGSLEQGENQLLMEKEGLLQQNHELSDQLRTEMNRLYRLEGGRQIIEKCQEPALHRLDAYLKRHMQKRVQSERNSKS